VLDGFAYLATRKNLLMTFLVDLSAMVLALPKAVFPAVGAVMIGGGAGTAAALAMAIAVGSGLAAVLSGPVARVRRQGLVIAWSVAAWGAGVAAFGLILLAVGHGRPQGVVLWALVASCAALAFCGAADIVSAVLRGTILQTAAPDRLRGRLQGVFIVVVTGGPRLGDAVMGGDAALLGEGWAVLIGGLACIFGVVALTRWQPGFLAYDAANPVP